VFFFSSRRRHTRSKRDWSSDVCSSDLTAPRPLADPAPPEIITPPQYSIAWVILALLCVLVIIVLVVATLKITRAVEKRIAYRRRPDAVEALKAEFLRTVDDIADRHEDERLDSRAGQPELP